MLTLAIVTIIILSFAWILILPKYPKHKDNKNALATAPQVESTQASQTAQIANSSPSPSPSPEVLSGYCLQVPILMYHHIQPTAETKEKGQTALSVDNGTFDSQMAYLKSALYTTITLEQLAQALTSHGKVPGKSVVVTLDDGYQDQYTYAFPIAQKYGIKLNLFIATGLINNSDYMNWDQLKQMVQSGTAVTYDHTWSHTNLSVSSVDKIKYEITTAKTQLKEYLGQNAPIFAYPYGSETNTVISILRENGFTAAASTIPGTTQCDSFIMSLHRTRIGGSSLRAYGL